MTVGFRRAEILVAVLTSAGAVAIVTAAIAVLEPYVPVLSLGVVYLFAVLPVAVAWGLPYAIAVSVAGMLAFNWFYLPPRHTFSLSDGANWFALAIYLVTAVVVSDLAARARRRARESEQRSRESALLARIGTALLRGVGIREELDRIGADAAAVLGVAAVTIELGPAGEGYPLRAGDREIGRLVVSSGERPEPVVVARFLPSLASLVAVALDQEALEREDAVKTALLRAVSHDLRSPLTAISAAVSGLEDSGLRLGANDRAGLLETIRIESDRLAGLVSNLLDLSRLEAGAAQPHPELWTVDELVGRALEELHGGHERVQVALARELPPVQVDAAQIQRVLVNLLENALKFSAGAVRVEGRPEAGEVVLEIHDEGPGLAPDEAERVFQPFHRGAAQRPGAGLGLAIARGFAEANGARVWAEPGRGGGCFVLTLPALSEAAVGA
jgi:two-component system sensor histidine kinase KdpD